MDSLIHAITSFKLSDDKKDEIFDNLISQFETLDTHDPESEWETITSNYSKLLFLHHNIISFEFPETEKFKQVLMNVLSQIDKKNNYYLNELIWDIDGINDKVKDDCDYIQELFHKSLQMIDPLPKLQVIMEAYTIFIPILEDFRNEKIVEYVDDQQFLEEFQSLKKKRKI